MKKEMPTGRMTLSTMLFWSALNRRMTPTTASSKKLIYLKKMRMPRQMMSVTMSSARRTFLLCVFFIRLDATYAVTVVVMSRTMSHAFQLI